MGKKTSGFTLTTMISALLFSTLIIIASLSPLSELGANANKFGSFGMWGAVGMVLVLYLLPLITYKLAPGVMRFVMAIFCSIGLLINISTVGVVFILGVRASSSPYLAWIVGICVAAFIVNIIWFFVTFRSTEELSTHFNN